MDQLLLKEISEAAINGEIESIRELLKAGANYKTARLYVEAFYHDKEASDLILAQATCKCGLVAFKWNPDPICSGCLFKEAMGKIEY